jgi:hypothetical protein
MAKTTKQPKKTANHKEVAAVIPPPPASHFGGVQKFIGIPTVWADTVVFGVNRNAALVMLRFFSVLDDAAIEVARVQLPEPLVKDVLNTLCAGLNHYPTRPFPAKAIPNNGKKRKRD